MAATGADLVFHLVGGHLDVPTALSAGTVALFAVAGGGALVRGQSSRAMRWAREKCGSTSIQKMQSKRPI